MALAAHAMALVRQPRCLLLLLLPFLASTFAAASSPSELGGHRRGLSLKCPAKCFPVTDCDFTFQQTKPINPTFDLLSFKVPPPYVLYKSTYPPASAPVYPRSKRGYSKTKWSSVVLTVGQILAVNPIPKLPLAGSCDVSKWDQFYFTPFPVSSKQSLPFLTVRAFQPQLTRGNFTGNCFKVIFKQAQLSNGTTTIVLNPGDKNAIFPERKRCVIFKSLYKY